MNTEETEVHARLGLPVPKGTRLRTLKRLVAKLNWFFLHHQVAFNREILTTLDGEVLGSTGLRARLDEQSWRLETHDAQLAGLDGRLEGLGVRLDGLDRDVWAAMSGQTQRLDTLEADLWAAIAAQSAQVESANKQLWSAVTSQITRGDALDTATSQLWAALSNASASQTAQLDSLSRALWAANSDQTTQLETLSGDLWTSVKEIWDAVIDAREMLDEEQAALQVHVDLMQQQAFARHHAGIGALRSELVEMSLQIAEIQKSVENAAADMRRRRGAVDALLDEVRRSLPRPVPADSLAAVPSAMEAMYPEFQEAFRGSPEYIAGILKDYLPDILALDRQGPLVDLGSGRGEWLEILRNAGVEAYGVDTSEDFAKQCQERGLKVVLADACEHLATLPERSLSAVTAFHLVEHLPIEGVIRLIDLALRALHSGGVLIFETPNPENLVVGASSFYLDPSHVRPLPPGLLAFLLEARGLSEVETRYLHPNDAGNIGSPLQVAPWADDVAPLVQEINSRFFGPQDYAVIGRRV